jgi:hypothetical protein
MQLRELKGQLIADKTPQDVIKGQDIEQFHGFLVSEQVANELRKVASYLAPDYWYLVINKDLSINDEQLHWEITVRDIVLQLPIEGVVKFEDDSPILAFSWE